MDWESGGRVHNWKNYVNDRLQKMWEGLTPEVQDAIRENAQEIADREDWD